MKRILLICGMLLVTAMPSCATWAIANGNTGKHNAPGTAGTSRAVTITSSTSGNLICLSFAAQNTSGGSPTVTSVVDNASGGSNTYTLATDFAPGGNNQRIGLYCSNDGAGHWITTHGAATTVTLTMSANVTSFLDAYVTEYSYTAGATVTQDVTGAGTSGSSAAALTSSITPTGTSNLVIAFAQAPSVSAVNNSYNLLDSTDGNGFADKRNVTATSTNVTFTTTSGGWFTIITSFKATGGGAATCTNRIALLGAGCS